MQELIVVFADTITLFNYHKKTGYWYSRVLHGVDVGEDFSGKKDTTAVQNEDTVRVLLHCNSDKSIKVGNNRLHYLSPKDFANTDYPANNYTIDKEQDFVVAGDCASVPIDDNSEENGLYHRMNDTRDGVYAIKSCSYYGLIPHFEIVGK